VLTVEEKEILSRFKAQVDKILGNRLDRIILFGSRSRGDAEPDSDFDLLVTVRGLQERDKKKLFDVAADLSLEYGTVLTLLVLSPEEFTEDHYFYLYENIQRQRQVV
jgi:predicted nucleotidyltransferase